MSKIAVVTANLGGFEKREQQHVRQSIDCSFFCFNDANFPPRKASMTPRLQARIVKMFMWQMVPGFDYYLWVDSSMDISDTNTVKWFMDQLGDDDIAVFRHPHRKNIQEEADYLKKRLSIKCPYITPRYENELIDEQLAALGDISYPLYASTAFIYKNSYRINQAMKEWWYHTSRFHSIDQLSFSYVVNMMLMGNVIPENYLKIPYLTYVRNK